MGRGFLGFGRNLVEIRPTSLPELSIQLRDLRNNQKSLKTKLLETIVAQKHKKLLTFPCTPFKCVKLVYIDPNGF